VRAPISALIAARFSARSALVANSGRSPSTSASSARNRRWYIASPAGAMAISPSAVRNSPYGEPIGWSLPVRFGSWPVAR